MPTLAFFMRFFRATVALAALTALLPIAAASTFPDIQDGHRFQTAIETLVNAGVIKGNPDGKFYPDRAVNRAEMLKMLYLATGKEPDPLSIRCFPDVAIGSWYESYVCDAAARRYVGGYADGTFKPGDSVNRVEALKMILQVLGINVGKLTEQDRELVKFVDVSTSAWYTPYLYTAFSTGVLPVPGQDTSRFGPESPLSRGEAAAYIFNALHVDLTQRRASSSANSREMTSSAGSVTSSVGSTASAVSRASVASTASIPADTVNSVSFPFSTTGKFQKKLSVSYRFTISDATEISVTASPQSGQTGQISCQLYLLNTNGFSDRYFLGYEDGGSCKFLSAITPGNYQLQLQPSVADTTFSVSASKGMGDGNDGFSEAKGLTVGTPRTDILAANDLEDWFKFTVGTQQNMTVNLSNAQDLRCVVYAMADVQLASFAGPECNQIYMFPTGTYYVAVGRRTPATAQESFTLKLVK